MKCTIDNQFISLYFFFSRASFCFFFKSASSDFSFGVWTFPKVKSYQFIANWISAQNNWITTERESTSTNGCTIHAGGCFYFCFVCLLVFELFAFFSIIYPKKTVCVSWLNMKKAHHFTEIEKSDDKINNWFLCIAIWSESITNLDHNYFVDKVAIDYCFLLASVWKYFSTISSRSVFHLSHQLTSMIKLHQI